jgi:hypothetical protein
MPDGSGDVVLSRGRRGRDDRTASKSSAEERWKSTGTKEIVPNRLLLPPNPCAWSSRCPKQIKKLYGTRSMLSAEMTDSHSLSSSTFPF